MNSFGDVSAPLLSMSPHPKPSLLAYSYVHKSTWLLKSREARLLLQGLKRFVVLHRCLLLPLHKETG